MNPGQGLGASHVTGVPRGAVTRSVTTLRFSLVLLFAPNVTTASDSVPFIQRMVLLGHKKGRYSFEKAS